MENLAPHGAYYVLWSVIAIFIGILFLFFRKWFVEHSKTFYSHLHNKTNLSFFKDQEQQLDGAGMNLLITILGIVFLIVGIFVLINNL